LNGVGVAEIFFQLKMSVLAVSLSFKCGFDGTNQYHYVNQKDRLAAVSPKFDQVFGLI
jgi:hypothetical protein